MIVFNLSFDRSDVSLTVIHHCPVNSSSTLYAGQVCFLCGLSIIPGSTNENVFIEILIYILVYPALSWR